MKNLLISIMFSAIVYSSAVGMGLPAEEQKSLGLGLPAALAAAVETISTSQRIEQQCIIKIDEDVDQNVAEESQTIKEMIEELGDDVKELHLNCTKEDFDLVLPFMQLQHDCLTSLKDYEKTILVKLNLQLQIVSILRAKTSDEIVQIVITSNYLNIQPLLDTAIEALGARLNQDVTNLNDSLVCPYNKILNNNPDIRRLLIDCLWESNFVLWNKKDAFRFWIEKNQELKNPLLKIFSFSIGECFYALGGSRIATGFGNSTVKIYDVNTREFLQIFSWPGMRVNSVELNTDGSKIAIGFGDTTVKVYDVNTRDCLQIFSGHKGNVISVMWSLDNSMIVTGSEDKTAKIWNVETGTCEKTFYGHTEAIFQVVWCPDCHMIATVSNDNTIMVWDVRSGECLQIFFGDSEDFNSIAWSPDSRKIAVSGQKVKIWDVNTGKCQQKLFSKAGIFTQVAWSSDGSKIVTGSWVNVKIWDALSGNCLQILPRRKLAFISALWFRNGKIVFIDGEGVNTCDINVGLLDYLHSISIEQALFLLYAHECSIKNEQLDLSAERYDIFISLSKDLQQTILQTFESIPSIVYATLEPVD